MASINQVKQLRQETGVSVLQCKKALEESKGDLDKAKEVLRKKGLELAGKKSQRAAGSGIIDSYVHPDSRKGVLLELRCETDFVAKSDDFKNLAHEICLQIAAMYPEDQDSLLSQAWIKDESKTIKDLIAEYISKLGENIIIKEFSRFAI
jgi:elongation factor Ts